LRDCVEHFIGGRNAWHLGILGFFTRIRGVASTVCLTVITMGTPFWWPDAFPKQVVFELKYLALILLFLISGSAASAFYYLRRRSIRSLNMKHHLHELSHYLRDYQTKLYKRQERAIRGAREEDEEDERFRDYVGAVCERIKDYFADQVNDPTINVAIRLAIELADDQGRERVFYHTVGRSSGLSSARAETTHDCAANEGIARFLLEEKGCRGVLIYNDLKKAADQGAFKLTQNEGLYSSEIVTMMVSPLNAWDRKKQAMIGILFVTSRKTGAFSVQHTDSMRFVADTTAKAIAFSVDRLRAISRMPRLARSKA
jgi:hypothetical protein